MIFEQSRKGMIKNMLGLSPKKVKKNKVVVSNLFDALNNLCHNRNRNTKCNTR
tara:strand:- start:827 stop:985 length:159 start_codon:yes stop_codon:yes gene_type:complete